MCVQQSWLEINVDNLFIHVVVKLCYASKSPKFVLFNYLLLKAEFKELLNK